MITGQVDGGGTPIPSPTSDIFEYPEAPPVDDVLPLVENLMQVDEDCLLPCFWGFHLGENSIEETTEFVISNFQQIPYSTTADEREVFADSEEPSTRGIDFYSTFLPLSDGQLQVIFGSIDYKLVRIDIQLYEAVNWLKENPFLLSELLNTYGEPSHVYLSYAPSPSTAYVLAVVYEDKGFIVEYSFGNSTLAGAELINERITEQGRFLICVEDPTYDSIQLTLQLDGKPRPLLEVLQPSLDDPSVYRPFWNIKDMTGLSVEEFTEIFAGDSNACIEVYSLAELRELGYE